MGKNKLTIQKMLKKNIIVKNIDIDASWLNFS